MRNEDFIRSFVEGLTEGENNTLTVDGTVLYHYSTAIALRRGAILILNKEWYSRHTSQIQYYVRGQAPERIECSEDIFATLINDEEVLRKVLDDFEEMRVMVIELE